MFLSTCFSCTKLKGKLHLFSTGYNSIDLKSNGYIRITVSLRKQLHCVIVVLLYVKYNLLISEWGTVKVFL